MGETSMEEAESGKTHCVVVMWSMLLYYSMIQ